MTITALRFHRQLPVLALACAALFSPPSLTQAEIVSSRTEAVEDAISHLPNLGPHSIEIETHHGFVHLTGTVNSADDSARIERSVRALNDVTSLKNDLTVREVVPPEKVGRSKRIAQAIRDRIAADHSLGHYDIEVLPNVDTVALAGSAAREQDRTTIERLARSVSGVVKVDNRLTIAPPESDEVVEFNVREALQKAGDVDLAGLEISADGGTVTFSGTRADHREIDRILGVAVMVNGVREIKSEMTIAARGGAANQQATR